MSKRQSDRKIYRAPGRQTERQNDSMADSRAAKEPALVILYFHPNFGSHASTGPDMGILSIFPKNILIGEFQNY